jgi:hypothetical protein
MVSKNNKKNNCPDVNGTRVYLKEYLNKYNNGKICVEATLIGYALNKKDAENKLNKNVICLDKIYHNNKLACDHLNIVLNQDKAKLNKSPEIKELLNKKGRVAFKDGLKIKFEGKICKYTTKKNGRPFDNYDIKNIRCVIVSKLNK